MKFTSLSLFFALASVVFSAALPQALSGVERGPRFEVREVIPETAPSPINDLTKRDIAALTLLFESLNNSVTISAAKTALQVQALRTQVIHFVADFIQEKGLTSLLEAADQSGLALDIVIMIVTHFEFISGTTALVEYYKEDYENSTTSTGLVLGILGSIFGDGDSSSSSNSSSTSTSLLGSVLGTVGSLLGFSSSLTSGSTSSTTTGSSTTTSGSSTSLPATTSSSSSSGGLVGSLLGAVGSLFGLSSGSSSSASDSSTTTTTAATIATIDTAAYVATTGTTATTTADTVVLTGLPTGTTATPATGTTTTKTSTTTGSTLTPASIGSTIVGGITGLINDILKRDDLAETYNKGGLVGVMKREDVDEAGLMAGLLARYLDEDTPAIVKRDLLDTAYTEIILIIGTDSNVEEIFESLAKSGLGINVVYSFFMQSGFYEFDSELFDYIVSNNYITLSSLLSAASDSGIIIHIASDIIGNSTYLHDVINFVLGIFTGAVPIFALIKALF